MDFSGALSYFYFFFAEEQQVGTFQLISHPFWQTSKVVLKKLFKSYWNMQRKQNMPWIKLNCIHKLSFSFPPERETLIFETVHTVHSYCSKEKKDVKRNKTFLILLS